MTGPADIRLVLPTVRTFFDVEEADPFECLGGDLSGIDQVMAMLTSSAYRNADVSRLVISLPETAQDQDLVARLPRALKVYCDNKMKYCRRQRAAVLKEGRHTLRVGILFLAVCLALSAACESLLGEGSSISYLVGEGLLIAGWVALWHPMELLLYAWWPYTRDIKQYQRLQRMAVVIERRSAAS